MSLSSLLLTKPFLANHHLWRKDSEPLSRRTKSPAIGPDPTLALLPTGPSLHLYGPVLPFPSSFPQPIPPGGLPSLLQAGAPL